MRKQNAILIFDVGKTNKKLFLFDEDYHIMYEESKKFDEIKDEDSFACENINELATWIQTSFQQLCRHENFEITAVNFSAYGASLVHLNGEGKPLTPLYNYLKPFPDKLQKQFYNTYGSESLIARQTASPVLGSLNSGMQLYRVKYEQPEIFSQVKYSLHFPQYLSYLITGKFTSDITSIGCHTQLWDFQKNDYHQWVLKEDLISKFPAIIKSAKSYSVSNGKRNIAVGIGLHDSSAALIPYLKFLDEPFILISTGTWCISLNPFNSSMLTNYELRNDCLCYLSYEGKAVKASRLFAGYEHEQQVKKLAAYFKVNEDYYKTILYDSSLIKTELRLNEKLYEKEKNTSGQSAFSKRALIDYETYEAAYHQLMADIIIQQIFSTKLVLSTTPVKKFFVDGGFGDNDVYMNLLALGFPGIEVYSTNIGQASALGAAMALNIYSGNSNPADLLKTKNYTVEK